MLNMYANKEVYGKVENFPHAPSYDIPRGMNPLDMPDPHFLTPDRMHELGIRRKN
jgi:hypothetical protein